MAHSKQRWPLNAEEREGLRIVRSALRPRVGATPTGLTPRQREVVQVIREYTEEHNCSPSYKEIAELLSEPSNPVRVHECIKRLEERGHLTRIANHARSIRLLD